MIWCSKKSRENYPKKAFEQSDKETLFKFNFGLMLFHMMCISSFKQT